MLSSLQRETYGHQPGSIQVDASRDAARLPFTKSFHDACHLLVSGRNDEAFAEFNKGCGYVKGYLPERSYLVLVQILRLYSYEFWERFSDLRSHLLQYFRLMAAQTLANGHPFRDLLDSPELSGVLSSCAEQFLMLVATEYSPRNLPAQDWIWIQDEVAFRFYQLSNFDRAMRTASDITDAIDVPLEVKNKALCLIGRCYSQQGKLRDAATVFFRVVDICQKNYYRQDMRICLFSTLLELSDVLEATQDYVQSFEYCCRAFEEAKAVWGLRLFAVVDLSEYLKRRSARLGRPDEVARLEVICGDAG